MGKQPSKHTGREASLPRGAERGGTKCKREGGRQKDKLILCEREREREREMGLGLEPGTSGGDMNRGGKGEEGDSHGELTELLQLPYTLAQKRGREERGGRKGKISFV